jgi:hypothetical protein
VLRAIDKNFHNLNPKERQDRAYELRKKIANYLPELYDNLLGGELKRRAEEIKMEQSKLPIEELRSGEFVDYTIEGIRRLLLSNEPFDIHLLQLVSDYLGIDIYILECSTKDVPLFGEEELKYYYRNRPSIVLLHHTTTCEHFETIGLYDKDHRDIITQFSPDHEFIQKIRSRLFRSKEK